MTYEAQETSSQGGQPVELYHFTIGTSHYRYTSAEDEVSFSGNTYFPRQITRTDPAQSSEERRQQLEITLPAEDEVASRYIGVVPGELMSLVVTRFHRGDTEAWILWSGNITGASYREQGAVCSLRGVTTEAAFSRPIPRFKYQGLCNHILFDSGCGLDRNSYKFSATCSAISGSTVTVPGLNAAHGANWALGGYISFNDTDFRLVVGQSGDVLTLRLPFESDPTGHTLDVYAGCDHTLSVCNSKFSNNANYGGFAFVPSLNPFQVGIG